MPAAAKAGVGTIGGRSRGRRQRERRDAREWMKSEGGVVCGLPTNKSRDGVLHRRMDTNGGRRVVGRG